MEGPVVSVSAVAWVLKRSEDGVVGEVDGDGG